VVGRLTTYLRTNPRRGAAVVIALSAAAVVLIAGVLGPVLMDQPYPSEVTPLSLDASGDVCWTGTANISFVDGHCIPSTDEPIQGWSCNYSELRFYLGGARSGWRGIPVNATEQKALAMGSETTVVTPLGELILTGAPNIQYELVITDLLGDGAFGWGDKIALRESPHADYHEEDVTFTFALTYEHNLWNLFGEYSYAFHDGAFYSWRSSNLDWDSESPWYD